MNKNGNQTFWMDEFAFSSLSVWVPLCPVLGQVNQIELLFVHLKYLNHKFKLKSCWKPKFTQFKKSLTDSNVKRKTFDCDDWEVHWKLQTSNFKAKIITAGSSSTFFSNKRTARKCIVLCFIWTAKFHRFGDYVQLVQMLLHSVCVYLLLFTDFSNDDSCIVIVVGKQE